MRYGFIGAGNITSAIITGVVKGGVLADSIYIHDTDVAKTEALSRDTGVCVCGSEWIIEQAEIIFFGLKPYILPDVLRENASILTRRKDETIIVSLAAGVSIEDLCALVPASRIIRVMPNLNSAVGAGMSAICANGLCSENDIAAVIGFMSACGGTSVLDEGKLDIFSVLGGSTPAFTYIFIDSLARAALALGMPKQQALEIAAQSVMGSAKMLLNSGEHPWALADRVCSPGGLTVEGIRALQEGGFEHATMQAIIRAVKKMR